MVLKVSTLKKLLEMSAVAYVDPHSIGHVPQPDETFPFGARDDLDLSPIVNTTSLLLGGVCLGST